MVAPGREAAFLAPLPLRALPGIGPRGEQRLLAAGLVTIGDLARQDDDALAALGMGKVGRDLRERARGVDPAAGGRRGLRSRHDRRGDDVRPRSARPARDGRRARADRRERVRARRAPRLRGAHRDDEAALLRLRHRHALAHAAGARGERGGARRASRSSCWTRRSPTAARPCGCSASTWASSRAKRSSSSRWSRKTSGGDEAGRDALVEMRMRRAVLALGHRAALAGLALARERAAAAEQVAASLQLRLGGLDDARDDLVDCDVHARLLRDREVAPDLLEQAARRAGEIAGIGSKPFDRGLTGGQNAPLGLNPAHAGLRFVHEVLDREEDRAAVLVHALSCRVTALVRADGGSPPGARFPATDCGDWRGENQGLERSTSGAGCALRLAFEPAAGHLDRLRRAVSAREAAPEALRRDGRRAAADEGVDDERAGVRGRADHALEQRERLLRRVAVALARGRRDARDVPHRVERLAALEVVAPPVGVLVAAVLVGVGVLRRHGGRDAAAQAVERVGRPARVEQQHVVLARERVGRARARRARSATRSRCGSRRARTPRRARRARARSCGDRGAGTASRSAPARDGTRRDAARARRGRPAGSSSEVVVAVLDAGAVGRTPHLPGGERRIGVHEPDAPVGERAAAAPARPRAAAGWARLRRRPASGVRAGRARAHHGAPADRSPSSSGGCADARRERGGLLEMRVRRAVLAARQRRALAGLALAGGGAAAGVGLVQPVELDLDRCPGQADHALDRVEDARLLGDREVAADLLEEAAGGLREVARIAREPLHGRLRRLEHAPTRLGHTDGVRMRIDEVFELEIEGAAEAVHGCSLVTDGLGALPWTSCTHGSGSGPLAYRMSSAKN